MAKPMSGKTIDGVVIVVNSTTRVGLESQLYTIAIRHFFENATPKRVFFVFTRAQEGGMLDPDTGIAKAQEYVDVLWSSCNLDAKGFRKPAACFYPFEKDVEARNSVG